MSQSKMDHSLNKYFHDYVQLAEKESQKYRDIAFPNIEAILRYVNQQDPRFSRQPVRAGSYWQGLKVDKADEYDISVIMEGVGSLVWTSDNKPHNYGFNQLEGHESDTLNQDLEVVPMYDIPLPPPPKGYAFMSVTPSSWGRTDDLVRDGDLVPFLVKRRLKQLLTHAIRSLNLRGNVRVSRKAHGPALTVYFTSGKKEISVDFAPLSRSKLPFQAWVGWPRRTAAWPNADKVEHIKTIGIGQSAKKDFYWLHSFVEAEKELVNGIDADGGKRKELHRIMKMLNTDYWSNTSKPIVTSYILKNLWWWECEANPYSTQWDNDHLWIRLESMTRRLLTCIRERKLQQYFYPDMNLLEKKDPGELDIAANKIENFLSDPMRYLDPADPAC